MSLPTVKLRLALCSALLLILVAALPAVRAAGAAGDPSGSDLLAATASLAEVQQQVTGSWTPWYPQFEGSGLSHKTRSSSWIRSTEQEFRRETASGRTGVILSRVDLYKDEASAKLAYADLSNADFDGTKILSGVTAGGDQQRAFTYEYPVVNGPEDAYRMETFTRLRVGGALVLVDVMLPEYITAGKLTAIASPVVARTTQVLAGSLTAAALPATLTGVMPPASVATIVGPLLGQAAISVETFSSSFVSDGELARNRTFGISTIGYQAYALDAARGQYVEVHIIPTKDEASARQWVLTDADGKPSLNTLVSGATGNVSIFRKVTDFNNYDYQFARNKYVVVVRCAPFNSDSGDVSPSCEGPMRKAAEAVYASLPSDVAPTPTAPPRTTPTATATPSPTAPPATTTPAPSASQPAQTPTTAPRPPQTGSGQASNGDSRTALAFGLVLVVLGATAASLSRRRR